MREYQQQKKIKRRIFSKISIIFLFILFLLLARSTLNVYKKDRESAANLARVNASLVSTQGRLDSLTKETERLQRPEGIEEEIRHNFQVAKEGEKVIVVIDDQNTDKIATSTPSLFSRIIYAILSLFK